MEHKPSRQLVLGLLKAEKARCGLTFNALSERLGAIGMHQSASNLSSKFSTGVLSAQLFVALLSVMGVKRITINESDDQAEQHTAAPP